MKFLKTQRAILLFIVVTIFAAGTVFAQKQTSGTWKAKFKEKSSEEIHISFYSEGADGDGQHGSSFKFARLQGLSKEQVTGSRTNVSFSMNSEAGNIDLKGSFENGRGNGTYIYTPDLGFVSSLRGFGFDDVTDRELFSSAVLDVKLSLVSELRNSGLTITDYDDIFKATIFKIDARYINDMSQAGFDNLDMEDLVKGRIFKIDAEYARQVIAMGFGRQSLEELVKFRIFKVTPEFLGEMRTEGFTDLNAEQVVQLRIFKINPEFIREMRAKGYSNPTVEDLVQLKIRGRLD